MKTVKFFSAFLICFLLFAFSGKQVYSAPEYLWGRNAGGPATEYGEGIAVSEDMNTFITGHFNGTADFGDPSEPGYTQLISSGAADIYIAKMDPDGGFLWARRAGGPASNDYGLDIAVDIYSNIYVTGIFQGTADFGDPSEPGYTQLVSSGSFEIFIAKLDTDGNFLWARKAGGSGLDEGTAIAVHQDCSPYITGDFSYTADFGDPSEPGYTQLVASGDSEIFIAKLDTDGNFLWARKAGGTLDDFATGIDIDAIENLYISGFFKGTADFGDPSEPGYTQLTADGTYDACITSLDTDGNFLWTRKAGGTEHDVGLGVAVDQYGNSCFTGVFYGTGNFGDPSEPGYAQLISSGGPDIFISKLDAAGNYLWTRKAGGAYTEYSLSAAIDSGMNVYITGFFNYTADFGDPSEPGYTQLTPTGGQDTFTASLDSEGNFLWASNIGGLSGAICQGNAICTDSEDNIYSAGNFEGTLTIGDPGEPGYTQLTSNGLYDAFITKIAAAEDPDASISPSGITFTPGSPMPGDIVEICARIINLGDKPVTSASISFYYSLEPGIDLQLIDTVPCGAISGSAYLDVNASWNTDPGLDPMNYVITVIITDILPEDTDLDNNEASIEIPLPVEMGYFYAHGISGSVRVSWMTITEHDNLGFNLFRVRSAKESHFLSCIPVCINESLIPGQGTSSGPVHYEFTDHVKDKGDYIYILQSVSTEGETAEYRSRIEWLF